MHTVKKTVPTPEDQYVRDSLARTTDPTLERWLNKMIDTMIEDAQRKPFGLQSVLVFPSECFSFGFIPELTQQLKLYCGTVGLG